MELKSTKYILRCVECGAIGPVTVTGIDNHEEFQGDVNEAKSICEHMANGGKYDFMGGNHLASECRCDPHKMELKPLALVHLTFAEFQTLNARRCEQAFHPNGDKWPIQNWCLAIAGECGEALEVAFISQEWFESAQFIELFKELADIIIYCDSTVSSLGGDTAEWMNMPTFHEANGNRRNFYELPSSMSLPHQIAGVAMRAGRLCNLVKKVIRGDFSLESKRDTILESLTDIIAYCLYLIRSHGGDPGQVVMDKFDEVSTRIGWPRCYFGGNHSAAVCDCDPTDMDCRS